MKAAFDILILVFLVLIAIVDARSFRIPSKLQATFLLLCSIGTLILLPHDAPLHALSGSAIAAILLAFRRYAGSPGLADITVLFSLAVGYGGLNALFILTVALVLAGISIVLQSLLLKNKLPYHNAIPLGPLLSLAFGIFLLSR